MNATLDSNKYYDEKRKQDDAWEQIQEQHLKELETLALAEAAEKKKRDQTIFLGFFAIGLVATLLLSGAFSGV